MTRKQYVLDVTAAIQENPRLILGGHGIKANLLKVVSSRPDILAKLAVFSFATKAGRRGARGLKKTDIFKISVYKNFPEFNGKAREDVAIFQEKLPENDAMTFSNQENIITLIVLPDTPSGDVQNDIVSGKSVALTFDKAVKTEYKVPGGMYVTIMFGNSGILPRVETKAKAKAAINERKEVKRKPAIIKAEFKRKQNAKLNRLNSGRIQLQAKARVVGAELQEFNKFGRQLTGLGNDASATKIFNALNKYTANNQRLLSNLSPSDLEKYNKAVAYYKRGNNTKAAGMLRSIDSRLISSAKYGQTLESAISKRKRSVLNKRIGQIEEKWYKMNERLEAYDAEGNAKGAADTRFAMRKMLAAYKAEKAKTRALSVGSVKDYNAKVRELDSINKMIEANLAKSASVGEALANAIANSPASQEMKSDVVESVMQQVISGTPEQYAPQQAVQSVRARLVSMQQQLSGQQAGYDDESYQYAGGTNLTGRAKLSAMQRQLASQQAGYDDESYDYVEGTNLSSWKSVPMNMYNKIKSFL